jgi:hypothetical protein
MWLALACRISSLIDIRNLMVGNLAFLGRKAQGQHFRGRCAAGPEAWPQHGRDPP